MRIFACSDFHGARVIMDKLPRLKGIADLILLCGDLCGKKLHEPTEDLPAFQRENLRYLTGILDGAGIDYRYIFGNDDWIDDLSEKRLSVPEMIGGVTLCPLEQVLPFSKKANRQLSEEGIARLLEPFPGGERVVVIAHTPPMNCCDLASSGKRCGSAAARRWIEDKQPLAWFCGHIHEDFSTDTIGKTRVFNCAVWLWGASLRGWLLDTDTGAYDQILIE